MERTHESSPLWLRLTHWLNAGFFVALLWSGFSIFANQRRFASWVHLLPSGFWTTLHLRDNGEWVQNFHEVFAALLIANALLYFGANAVSGHWRDILPRRSWLADTWRALRHEFSALRPSASPGAYNGAQRLAYTGVFALGALMIATGFSMWFGREVPWLPMLFGGRRTVVVVHVCSALAFISFIAVHVLQVLRAGWPTLRSMLLPAREQLVADVQMIEHLPDRVVENVVDARRPRVHSGNRRQNHGADLRELRQRPQVTEV